MCIPSNTWLLGPTRVHVANDISIGSAVFAGLTIVTDQPRDSVCSYRPHLANAAMRPKDNNKEKKNEHIFVTRKIKKSSQKHESSQARKQVPWAFKCLTTLPQLVTRLGGCGQRVPGDCTGDGEVSDAEYRSCSLEDQRPSINRPYMSTAGHRRNRYAGANPSKRTYDQ